MFKSAHRKLIVLSVFCALIGATQLLNAQDDLGPRDRMPPPPPPEDYDSPKRREMNKANRSRGDRPMRGSRMNKDGKSHPSGRWSLTEEEVREAMEVLREYSPELAERIARWQEEDTENLRVLIGKRLPWVRRLIYMKRNDPQRYELSLQDLKLQRETQELARRFRDADDSEREELGKQLRQRLAAQFEVRQKVRTLEIGGLEKQIEALEKRIDEMKKQIDERSKSSQKLIDSRYEELTSQNKSMKW